MARGLSFQLTIKFLIVADQGGGYLARHTVPHSPGIINCTLIFFHYNAPANHRCNKNRSAVLLNSGLKKILFFFSSTSLQNRWLEGIVTAFASKTKPGFGGLPLPLFPLLFGKGFHPAASKADPGSLSSAIPGSPETPVSADHQHPGRSRYSPPAQFQSFVAGPRNAGIGLPDQAQYGNRQSCSPRPAVLSVEPSSITEFPDKSGRLPTAGSQREGPGIIGRYDDGNHVQAYFRAAAALAVLSRI